MAIVKCKSCGKDISDKTEKCIHCGVKNEDYKNNKNTTGAIIFIVFVMIIVLLTILYVMS